MKKWLFILGTIGILVIVFTNLVNGFEETSRRGPIHILAGIDSLTNGRLHGENKSRYLDDFIPKLKKKFGDGGPGYVPFDSRFFNQEGGEFKYSAGLKEINDMPHNMYPARYSFDYKGLYANFGHADSVFFKLNKPWKYGKLIFLKQMGGGTFNVVYPSGASLKVNTNGRRGLGIAVLPKHQNDQPIRIKNITGKVALFGGYFYNADGVVVSRVGQGGDRLAWFGELNRQEQKQWIQALQPDLFIFNGGMNDRGAMNAKQYRSALARYLAPFREASCPIILTVPNAIRGDEARLKEYEQELRAYAEEYHTGLFSAKAALGKTYQAAQERGYMGDSIHPNEKGAKAISQSLLQYLDSHQRYRNILRAEK